MTTSSTRTPTHHPARSSTPAPTLASTPASTPSSRRRGRAGPVWLLAIAVHLSLLLTALIAATLTRAQHRLRFHQFQQDEASAGARDEGSVLADVAMAVGLVLIAGLVLLAIRGKATTMTNNICTNADPSTC